MYNYSVTGDSLDSRTGCCRANQLLRVKCKIGSSKTFLLGLFNHLLHSHVLSTLLDTITCRSHFLPEVYWVFTLVNDPSSHKLGNNSIRSSLQQNFCSALKRVALIPFGIYFNGHNAQIFIVDVQYLLRRQDDALESILEI